MSSFIELPVEVKKKLEEAVILWADSNLIGKPHLLANCIYIGIEKEFIKKIQEINESFPDK